jgi:hypothetical protein
LVSAGKDDGSEQDPPGDGRGRRLWLARWIQRHFWFRVLVHLYLAVRNRRHARWHLSCAWREIYDLLKL